jgi:hypothetical protein
LERAYQNGWRPAGTGAPWQPDERQARVATIIQETRGEKRGRWPESDYFSASLQHVYVADALALGMAVMRGRRPTSEFVGPDPKRETAFSRIGSFARRGGFVIGRAPARTQPPERDTRDRGPD